MKRGGGDGDMKGGVKGRMTRGVAEDKRKRGAMAIAEVRQMKGWRDGSPLPFSAAVPLW